ncbi:hypothetical protein FO488_05755 [Geobacter sp. FeAm09]|uniref:hypothetical protein n=1 Tax=Geobacter sp. FeAm09 TaxID=2597769 RepID=UPI0011EF3798|nr:hypothetical protein [Geobacter sp. FeAm09]QEM67706.1 hypothetical protein FO488_05755 [Geobacter sp. FeAm09]
MRYIEAPLKRLIVLLILTVVTMTGCGGGGSTVSGTSSSTVTPAAKFTTNELSGNTIYTTTPANSAGTFNAITFNANGTVSESLNMTTTSTSSATATLTGTYSIDSAGVLTITLTGKTAMLAWKISASADGYNSYSVQTSDSSTLTQRWFYNQTIGASQALACATGTTIPTADTSSASFTASGIAGKTLGVAEPGYTYAYAVKFNNDGTISTGQTVAALTQINATWSVSGNVLTTNLPDNTYKVLTYTLISDDTVNRVWKTLRTYPDNATEYVWFFYDQTTGLTQAQAFVAAGGTK